MKYNATDSLAGLLNISHRRTMDLGAFPTPILVKHTTAFYELMKAGGAGGSQDAMKMVRPENDAVRFYALNQMVAVISRHYAQDQKLPDTELAIVREYVAELVAQTNRLLHYMLLVCTRETRHLHQHGLTSATLSNLNKNYGPELLEFRSSLPGGSIEAAERLMKKPPSMPIGLYTRGMQAIFDTCKFSSSYGGKPWANIARCLADFVNGVSTAEMMVDTAYTLAHNTGPMFNKGMMYHEQSNAVLYRVLDIQRSGQMVEAILEECYNPLVDFRTKEAKDALYHACAHMRNTYPQDFGKYLDWQAVKLAGAVQNYDAYFLAQKAKYGDPSVEKLPIGAFYPTNKTYKAWPYVALDILQRKKAA